MKHFVQCYANSNSGSRSIGVLCIVANSMSHQLTCVLPVTVWFYIDGEKFRHHLLADPTDIYAVVLWAHFVGTAVQYDYLHSSALGGREGGKGEEASWWW